MIVDNLNLKRIRALPSKTNPPLLINPDAMPARAISFKRLKLVQVEPADPPVVEPGAIAATSDAPPVGFAWAVGAISGPEKAVLFPSTRSSGSFGL
jgi:hypothetical protein